MEPDDDTIDLGANDQVEEQAPPADPEPKKARRKRAPKLDKSRSYATVHGQVAARFFQDGAYFDGNGNPVKV